MSFNQALEQAQRKASGIADMVQMRIIAGKLKNGKPLFPDEELLLQRRGEEIRRMQHEAS